MKNLLDTLCEVVESVMNTDQPSGYCVCCEKFDSHLIDCPINEAINVINANGRFVNTNGNSGYYPAPEESTCFDTSSDPRLMGSADVSSLEKVGKINPSSFCFVDIDLHK